MDDIIEEFLDSDEGLGAFRVSDPRIVAAQNELNRIKSLVAGKISKGKL